MIFPEPLKDVNMKKVFAVSGPRPSLPVLFGAFVLLLMAGCFSVQYSFTGGSIRDGIETVSVETLDNNATLIVPTLALDLTEALKDRFVGQTNLRLVNYNGDMAFSGAITRYEVAPIAIQGDETAAQNRLTITVKIKYENEKYPDDAWDNGFTQFSDFESSQNLSDVEATLVEDIVDKLTQDIFNKATSNW